MKDHVPTLTALVALFLLLATVIALTMLGVKPEGLAMMGIAGGIGGIVAAISPSFVRGSQPSQTTNAPNATTVTNDQANGPDVKA